MRLLRQLQGTARRRVAFHTRRSEQAGGVSVIFTATVASRGMSVGSDSHDMAANETEIDNLSGTSINAAIN